MNNSIASKIGAALVAGMLSAPSFADDGLSYTYLEAGYLDTEIDIGPEDVDGDGVGVAGSFAVNETFFLTASYGTQDFDFGVDVDQWSAGIGAHTSLTDNMDLVGTISYVDAEVDTPFGSVDDDGFGLGVGVRGRFTDNIELEAGINYVDLDDAGDDTSFAAGGRYYFTEAFAVGAGFEIGDDVTMWTVGVRMEF